MLIEVYHCAEGEYSKKGISAKLSGRVLHHPDPDRGKLEVEYCFFPEIREHSDGKFNLMLKHKNESLNSADRKYFAHVSWWQKRQIIWMYNNNWIQSPDNIWKIISFFSGGIAGWFLHKYVG